MPDERRAAELAEIERRNGQIYADFAADVLERLKRHGCTMNGCPIVSAKAHVDGRFSVRFAGQVNGIGWEKGLSLNFPLLHQKKWLGDPSAVTDAVLQLAARYPAESPIRS